MKNVKMIVLCMCFSFPVVGSEFVNDGNFSFQLARIIYLLEKGSWGELKTFESDNIRCGFGPGEEGPGCIETKHGNDPVCMEKLLVVLRQGCYLTQKAGQVSCVSPPQSQNPNVIMPLGPRARLSYDLNSEKVKITAMICGGD